MCIINEQCFTLSTKQSRSHYYSLYFCAHQIVIPNYHKYSEKETFICLGEICTKRAAYKKDRTFVLVLARHHALIPQKMLSKSLKRRFCCNNIIFKIKSLTILASYQYVNRIYFLLYYVYLFI